MTHKAKNVIIALLFVAAAGFCFAWQYERDGAAQSVEQAKRLYMQKCDELTAAKLKMESLRASH